jgi:periplasmic protein TonB
MSVYGLSPGSRLFSITLAVGVHAVAAAAFMLTPAKEPPPSPDGVEIEMLAEITSVVAEEVPPSVTAAEEEAKETTEARMGETADVEGEVVEEVTALDKHQPEVTPDQVEEIQKPEDQSEADKPPEAETTPEAETAPEAETPPEQEPITMPVELEKPAIEAPQAPAFVKEPKPERKVTKKAEKTEKAGKTEKKSKTVKRRTMVAASALTREAKRKGESQAKTSGGRKSSSQYRSIVQARLSSRRSAIRANAGTGVTGKVIISFSIGASGRVTSASVSKSSGNSRLDAAARSVVASTSFPPPPGGSFSSGVPISVE